MFVCASRDHMSKKRKEKYKKVSIFSLEYFAEFLFRFWITLELLHACIRKLVCEHPHLPFAPLISVVPPIKDFNPKFGDEVLSLIFCSPNFFID